MTRIAIDISPTSDGNSARGVGFYTSRLVPALQSEIKTNPEFKDFQIDLIRNSCLPAGTASLEIGHFDLIHYPFFDPFQLTLPPRRNTPTVVTVHDLIPRQFKSHFPVGIKGEIRWLIQKHRLGLVDYIITDSHSSKYAIHRITGYPTEKMYTIYLAADAIFKPVKDKKKLLLTKQKYHLPNKFVLYVGDINWNKNIPTLVNTCQKLQYPLVIVGKSATQSNVINHPWNRDLLWLQQQHRPNLLLTGFVPDLELNNIYNLATMYCQPSFAEGFGLPLLEAMQAGCPIAYSQESSVGEIMDFHGEMFNPYLQPSIETAIKKLWTSLKLRQSYIRQGLKYTSTFSWQSTAIQTLSVYKLAILSHG